MSFHPLSYRFEKSRRTLYLQTRNPDRRHMEDPLMTQFKYLSTNVKVPSFSDVEPLFLVLQPGETPPNTKVPLFSLFVDGTGLK